MNPLEADLRAAEDPLDQAGLAEALLEDPPGTPTTHQGTVTRMPPGGGSSTSARHGQGRDDPHRQGSASAQKELDIAKTEMVKIGKVATTAQRELDIVRGETRLLNKVINGLQQRLDELEGSGSVGSDQPPLESGSSDDGWGPGPDPGRAHSPG